MATSTRSRSNGTVAKKAAVKKVEKQPYTLTLTVSGKLDPSKASPEKLARALAGLLRKAVAAKPAELEKLGLPTASVAVPVAEKTAEDA